MKERSRNSTLAISQDVSKRLDVFCIDKGITKKDFIEYSLDYFEKNGIDPLVHESPAQEMKKLIKRVDSIIGFIREQEKSILRPACEAIFSSEERIKLYLDSMATKKDIKSNQIDIKSLANLVLESKQSQELALKAIAKLIDAKEKTGVFTDLAKAYKS